MTPGEAPRTAFDFSKRLRPKTYSIAIYVVLFFVLAEGVFLISIFWFRQQFTLETEGPTLAASTVVQETVKPAPKVADTRETVPPVSPGEPTARLSVTQSVNPETRVLDLNEQARSYRLQGDLVQAENTLQQALEISPEHPNTLMSLAMLREAQGRLPEALQTWRKLVNASSSAATSPGMAANLQLARERMALLENKLQPQETGPKLPEPAASPKSTKKLAIADVIQTPSTLPVIPEQVTYDFRLRSYTSAGQPLSIGKMKVQVYLYDRLAGGEKVPAKITAKFVSDAPFAQPGSVETLKVSYQRSAQENYERKEFYGYVIKIFYDGELQDEKASSPDLLRP